MCSSGALFFLLTQGLAEDMVSYETYDLDVVFTEVLSIDVGIIELSLC
jgi:hypothetical protein